MSPTEFGHPTGGFGFGNQVVHTSPLADKILKLGYIDKFASIYSYVVDHERSS